MPDDSVPSASESTTPTLTSLLRTRSGKWLRFSGITLFHYRESSEFASLRIAAAQNLCRGGSYTQRRVPMLITTSSLLSMPSTQHENEVVSGRTTVQWSKPKS